MDNASPPIDVARIVQTIRDESRSRHQQIDQRIERAQNQLEERIPYATDDRLLRLVKAQAELFQSFRERAWSWLADQEPNYANVRVTVSRIQQLIASQEDVTVLGPKWSPRTWLKRALTPVRRFVLRRQHEINIFMRDALTYLYNHSAHVELMRMQLEMGRQLTQSIEVLLAQAETSRRYLREGIRAATAPILEYLDELHQAAINRQAGEIEALRAEFAQQIEDGEKHRHRFPGPRQPV